MTTAWLVAAWMLSATRGRVRDVPSAVLPRPFYEAAGCPVSGGQRLLLITYHFPPGSAVGGLRWQQFSQHFADRGWHLDVVTLDPSSFADQDPERLAQLPAGTRVFGVARPDLFAARLEDAIWKSTRRLRASLRGGGEPNGNGTAVRTARPDSVRRDEVPTLPRTAREAVRAYHVWMTHQKEMAWARSAAALGVRLAESEQYRAVITSGPPHIAHEAGRVVARRHAIPFVMDMRDPWSLLIRIPEPLASPVWWLMSAMLERRAVADAALIVANTESARRALAAEYPEAASRMITVMNGYDDEPIPPPRRDGRFVVAYAGSLYLDRDPRLLFRAAARVIAEFGLTPEDLHIGFIGSVDSYGGLAVADIAHEEGIGAFVSAGPPRSRRETMEYLAQASLLVSLPQDSTMQVPSKLFEYMCFEAWLLALAEPESATALLLRGSGADVVAPDDVDGMAAVLRERYQEHRAGVRPAPIARDERFSRRHQAGLLLDALEACVRGAERPGGAVAGAR